MDEAIKKYRQRRDARMKKRLDDDWITIKGTHVMVDEDKNITAGPERLRSAKNKAAKPTIQEMRDMQKKISSSKAGVTRAKKAMDLANGHAKTFDFKAYSTIHGSEAAEKEYEQRKKKAEKASAKYNEVKKGHEDLEREFEGMSKRYRGE